MVSRIVKKVKDRFESEDGFIAEMLWTVLAVALVVGIVAAIFPTVKTDIVGFFTTAFNTARNAFTSLGG